MQANIFYRFISKYSLWFPVHQISWVSEYVIFLCGLATEAAKETKFGTNFHKGDEDDAWILNTRIAQIKCAVPHLTMKNNQNLIQCCNNTHQGAPHTGKQMSACASDLGDASRIYIVSAGIQFICIACYIMLKCTGVVGVMSLFWSKHIWELMFVSGKLLRSVVRTVEDRMTDVCNIFG